MLEDNDGGYANGWQIGDNKTSEIAALFLPGLKERSLRRTKDGHPARPISSPKIF
jgi:hypothetical protein